MSRQNVEILSRCAELLNVGDWDALFEMYDDDVQVEFRDLWPVPDTPEVLRGREAFRRVVAHWTEPYDEFGAEVFQYIDADPWVICDTRWYRKSKDSDVRRAAAKSFQKPRIAVRPSNVIPDARPSQTASGA